jgi:hypothetical protein
MTIQEEFLKERRSGEQAGIWVAKLQVSPMRHMPIWSDVCAPDIMVFEN